MSREYFSRSQKNTTYTGASEPCSLYPGLPVIRIPARVFKSWAVWQNEKDSIPAKPQTSLQGATLKSCTNNINADKRPPVEV